MTEQLTKLCADLLAARKLEADANAHRIRIEEQITAIVDVPPEGSKTYAADGFKVTVRGSVSRKADFEAMKRLDIPANLLPIKIKEELDNEGLKWLESNMPELHRKLLPTITTKPLKTSVTVKEC